MSKYSLSALVAAGLLAGGMSVSSASAADLGGNCCADLEERIAELEATTARKGNRKVSLTVSGWVAQQVLWWDDGRKSDVYVGGIGTTLASNVKFTGEAQILPGWTAGYVLQLEADNNDPLVNQQHQYNNILGGAQGDFGVGTLQSYWFIKSDQLGKVSVGRQSPAGDNAAILVDGSGSLVPSNWVLFDNANMFLQFKGQPYNVGGAVVGSVGHCAVDGGSIIGGDCVDSPSNVIRYDSPSFGGFSVSADWGQDDYWDVYGRYAGEIGGFKVAATSGWSHNSQGGPGVPTTSANCFFNGNCSVGYWQSGLYVEHIATGLFAYGAYGREFLDDTASGFNDNPEHWMVKGGIRQRWNPLGHTVLYGSFTQRNNMLDSGTVSDTLFGTSVVDDEVVSNCAYCVTHSKLNEWSIGAVQEIDAAAMSLWIQYDHFDGNVGGVDNDGNSFRNSLEDFQVVKAGALINF